MAPNKVVGARLDDYYYKLFLASGLCGREIIENYLDILCKEKDILKEIELNEIQKQRHLLDLREQELLESSNIGIDIPQEEIDNQYVPILDRILEGAKKVPDNELNCWLYELEDHYIGARIRALKLDVSIEEVREYIASKYPYNETGAFAEEIEIDYNKELQKAVNHIGLKYKENESVYKKKDWDSPSDLPLPIVKNHLKNFNVSPEDVIRELTD